MAAPPSRAGRSCLLVLLLVFAGVIAVAGAEEPAVGADGVGAQTEACDEDHYTAPALDRAVSETFTDPLANGSLDNWSGGALVAVGGPGDCSLVVTDNESARLTATAVNGTRGVVTGTLDLGSNGRLSLVGPNESQVSIANRGPDFSTTVVVSAGNESTDQDLTSGRFFEFAVAQSENGTVQVALWNAGDDWDRQWDASFETVTSQADLRVQLDGRAFLDGISVAVAEPQSGPTQTETPADDERESDVDGSGNEETESDDPDVEFPDDEDPEEFPGYDDTPDYDDDDDGAGVGGQVFWGLLMAAMGGFGYWYSYELTRFSEQLDAIGSTTRMSEVEPADWNVMLSKLISAGLCLLGVGMAVSAFF